MFLTGQGPERPVGEGEHLPSSKELDDQLESLNDQAKRCRRLATAIYDRDVAAMLGSMAEGFERTAEKLSKKAPG